MSSILFYLSWKEGEKNNPELSLFSPFSLYNLISSPFLDMKPLLYIKTFFNPPTLSEIIEHELKEETTLLSSCEHAIKVAKFQKALSIAKIRALKDWADSELLNERMKDNDQDTR